MQVIKVPDVSFAGFYYPEILRELLLYFRRNKEDMGLTDENEYEVHVQLLRAFSLVGHLNNCRTDMIAQEMLIDSLRLLGSLKRLLKLIGVRLASASPAKAELLVKLSEVTTVDIEGFLPELSEFSTDSVPPLVYEILEEGGVDLQRTDRAAFIYSLQLKKSGTGKVSTTAPDVFTRTAGDTFTSAALFQYLFIRRGTASNGGTYFVTEFIDADNLRVIRVPNSKSPSFQTEEGLTWELKAFSANFNVENYTPGTTFAPFPSTPVAGDALYVGHPQCLPTALAIDISSAASGLTGVWEYYDGTLSKFNPTAVADNGDGTLKFNLNSILGTPDRHDADVEIEYLPTGAKERIVSSYQAGPPSMNYANSSGLFGQTTPSTDISDYYIRADWTPFENQDDQSNNFQADGNLTFNFPQDAQRSWNPYEVNGEDGIFLRYRIVSVSTPTAPVIEEIGIDADTQYMLATVTQGETIGPQIIGSSDGSASQSFSIPETPFFDDTEEVEIDETGSGGWVLWTRVENFLTSSETSRHYMVETDENDKATVTFGDGVTGKIPATGTDNIRATYRVGGDLDGNVGADEITTNADGVTGIAEVTNPRSATGWRMKDGGTEQDIERVKRDAPASLRTRKTAATIPDCELLAVREFVDGDGIKPVVRAVGVEEGLGPKTIKLLVVGSGGTTLSQDQKTELETYFNGDRYAPPPVTGVLLMNHKVGVFNYEPEPIIIKATVVWPGGNPESIRNALLTALNPLALEADGKQWTWDFGGYVSFSKINSKIHEVDPGIIDVPTLLINGAAASFRLSPHGLPTAKASDIQVTIQEAIT